jgi:soluble lytic murein transglycosylase-like protein
MDIQALRTLMELQAIQSIGSSATGSTTSSNDSTFSTMINELLGSYTNELEGLGDVATAIDSNDQTKQTISSYIQNLTLNGNVQVPQNVLNAIADWGQEAVTAATNTVTSITTSIQAGASTIKHNYEDIVKRASEKYGVPEKLISSIIKHESNFNNAVKSSAGAVGLMQLMPVTAKYVGVSDRTDPEQNIMGGTKYLSMMLDKYDGDLKLALAAYNAGPGNVDKYGGVPPFKETQNYLKKVLGTYQS